MPQTKKKAQEEEVPIHSLQNLEETGAFPEPSIKPLEPSTVKSSVPQNRFKTLLKSVKNKCKNFLVKTGLMKTRGEEAVQESSH